jgi:hypothetical protein
MSKLNIGLAVAAAALAAGWAIDHARRSESPQCDCSLEMLKERAWLLPQTADPIPVKVSMSGR